MPPITDRTQAKEGGYAQVREALLKFKGNVTDVQWGQWGGQLTDPSTGRKLPAKEFMEVTCTNNEVLESTEPLNMDISELFNFRVNTSDFKGSFWIDMFLASADAHKVLIPDGLKGKRITWEKQTLENENPTYNKTDWVIVGIEEMTGVTPTQPATPTADPMDVVAEIAIGKTEAELSAAIDKEPRLAGSQVLPLAKSGMLAQALIKNGKLALVDGKYQKP